MTILAKPKPIKVKKVKKARRKSSRQLLERELDRLVRSIVLLRDGFCVCPAPKNGHSIVMQPGHLITRVKEGVKYDLFNVNTQCSACNQRHSMPNQWRYYDTWFIENFGEAERLRIDDDAEKHVRYSVDDMLELRSQLLDIYSKQVAEKGWKPRFSQREILTGEWRKEIKDERK